jgi:hypothetical protein
MPAYISEISYKGGSTHEFVEVLAPTGTDMSSWSLVVYNGAGTVDQTLSLGSITSTTGGDVYVVDNTTPGFPGLNDTQSVALVDDLGNVVQFASWDGNTVTATAGPAAGLTSTDVGYATDVTSLETTTQGASYSLQTSPSRGTVPCYAPGTLIDTPTGRRPVETLRPGDLVLTRDHGAQPIRWRHSGPQPLEKVGRDGRPVLIKAGALGPGRPAQDLIVSPQHRIFVGGADQLDTIFRAEALAPAKSLTALPGIRHMMGKKAVTWIHFACQRHEVVRANGTWAESLLLGPMVLLGLPQDQRRAVHDLFGLPQGPCALNGPPARPCFSVGDARRMIAGSCKAMPTAA